MCCGTFSWVKGNNVIGNTVSIANKLEVLLGNVIMVPGCEPVSDFTSTTLAANMQCKTSVIKVEDALCKIPGSTLEFQSNPRRLFFVLPSGPPIPAGCNACDTQPDWYAMLRDICPPDNLPKTIQEIKVCNTPTHDFFLDDEAVNVHGGGVEVQSCNLPSKGLFAGCTPPKTMFGGGCR